MPGLVDNSLSRISVGAWHVQIAISQYGYMTRRLYDKTVILAYLSGKKGRMRDNNSIYGEQYLLLFNQQQFSKSTIVFLYITVH